MRDTVVLVLCWFISGVVVSLSGAAEQHMMQPRVPADKLAADVTVFPTGALLDQPKVLWLPDLGASTVDAEEICAVLVVEYVREFLVYGNVTSSVNFPETVLQRTRPNRVAIPHKNVPNMVAQILTCLAAQNINIADMLNHSRDELSYTLVDLDTQPTEETVERIRGITADVLAQAAATGETPLAVADRIVHLRLTAAAARYRMA